MSFPRILIIAGSDSGGGAGIQADIKTVSLCGGFAMTAITAITAQNTLGVQAIHALPAELVREQITSCLSDLGADAVKIGMLHNAATITAVREELARWQARPIVLDPVMVATSGDRLLDEAALEALKALLPHCHVLTPNLPEAELLSGRSISSQQDMIEAAKALQTLANGAAIVLKGGHLPGEEIHDLLWQGDEAFWFSKPRLHSPHTHGTGCTLASALTTIGAKGNALPFALEQAQAYVHDAIASAPGYGKGHGPLNHLHPLHA